MNSKFDDSNREVQALVKTTPKKFMEFVEQMENSQKDELTHGDIAPQWRMFWESIGLAAKIAREKEPQDYRKWHIKNQSKRVPSTAEIEARVSILAERAAIAASNLTSGLNEMNLEQASMLAAGSFVYSSGLKSTPSQLTKSDPNEIKALEVIAAKFVSKYSQVNH